MLNSKERPTLDEALAREVNPLTLDQLLALRDVGAQILDTRDPAEFAAAHLAGSINVGLGGQYATWAGTILNHEHPIVVIADPGPRARSGDSPRPHRLRSHRRLPEDGLHSLEARPDLTASTERISAPLAAERLAAGSRAGR